MAYFCCLRFRHVFYKPDESRINKITKYNTTICRPYAFVSTTEALISTGRFKWTLLPFHRQLWQFRCVPCIVVVVEVVFVAPMDRSVYVVSEFSTIKRHFPHKKTL